jgi:hypothetical protein
MRMKPLAVVACAALAVTAFTACGDDDDDSPTNTGVTVPTVTGDTTLATTGITVTTTS